MHSFALTCRRTHHTVGVFFGSCLYPRPQTAHQLLLQQPNGSGYWMCTGIDFTQLTLPTRFSMCVCLNIESQKLSNQTHT